MFSDEEKKVFSYNAGKETRWADPLAIRRALLRASTGMFNQWRHDSVEPEPLPPSQTDPIAGARYASAMMAALEAQERVMTCIRQAFDLPDVDRTTGEGMTETECWDAMDAYYGWVEKNEKRSEGTPTTSPADSPLESAGS